MRRRKCLCCGEAFEITGRTINKRYCCRACKSRANWLRRKLKSGHTYCHMCGKVVEKGGTVCAACKALAQPMVQQGYKLEELRRQVCTICGQSFAYVSKVSGNGGQRTVCDLCASSTKPQKYCAPKRKCHDCGRPTNNYRCPRCLSKWRIKNGIAAEPTCVDNDYDFYI